MGHRASFVAMTALCASLSYQCTVSQVTPTFENFPDASSSNDEPRSDGGALRSETGTTTADAGLLSDASTTGDGGAHPKLVFITSEGFLANLVFEGKAQDGVTGADNLCNRVAPRLSPRPYGKFRAWISSSKVDAIDHIVGNGPWYTYGGKLAFANKASIPAGPESLIWETEGGYGIDLGNVGTGTLETGKKAPSLNCMDWTEASSIYSYRYGVTNPGTSWTSQGTRDCSSSIHLYCFEE